MKNDDYRCFCIGYIYSIVGEHGQHKVLRPNEMFLVFYAYDNQEKTEILNRYFASVFAVARSEALPELEDRNFAKPVTYIDINRTKIAKAIDKLKASKSQGPDQIHPKLIKECKESLLKPLEIFFKNSLENSQLLNIWKQGNVTAIFKSGSKTKPENYRPISLTSVDHVLLNF